MKVECDYSNITNNNNKLIINDIDNNKITPNLLNNTITPVDKNINIINTHLNFTLLDSLNNNNNNNNNNISSKRNKFGFDSSPCNKLLKKEEFNLNLLQTIKDHNDLDDNEMIL